MAGEVLLNSWKEIARYVGRSERTVQRWERQCGFPVRRPAGKMRSAVIAIPSEIQVWSQSSFTNSTTDVGPLEKKPQVFEVAVAKVRRGPTLLCIDDHPEGLALRKVLLEALGYRVLTAPNAHLGLRLFETNEVDLVVLDYWISDLNGESLSRVLQDLKPRVPVLLLSGAIRDVPDTILKLVDSFVQKGQPTEVLLSAISAACGNPVANNSHPSFRAPCDDELDGRAA
jgi:CheY-like chemotaxis protein